MSKSACFFPGQGAQFAGMGRSVVERLPATQRLFDQAREILGYDLADACWGESTERLNSTAYSQPALYVCSLAAVELLRNESPEVASGFDYAAGLSLGEYTALTFAGAMSFEEGLGVVKVRGESMQAAAEANPSGMVSALMLKPEQVDEVVQRASAAGPLWVANYLCPGNTVLSGSRPGCEAAIAIIEELGGKPIPLSVAGAFHTELMESACSALKSALESVKLTAPRIPVISNVDAGIHTDPDDLRDLLVRQVTQPVRWEESFRWMIEAGVTQFYEVGPGKVLRGLLKRIDRKLECQSIGEA